MAPPTTPMKGMSEKEILHAIPEKGPYEYFPKTLEGMTPLQRHCAYFDRLEKTLGFVRLGL